MRGGGPVPATLDSPEADTAPAAPPDHRAFVLAAFVSLWSGLAMVAIGGDAVPPVAVAGHVAILVTICALTVLLRRWTRSAGAALVGALGLVMLLAVVPLGSGVTAVAAIATSAALWATRPRVLADLLLRALLAAALAAVVVAETDSSYANFLIGQRLETAAVHTDSVQHIGVSNMLLGEHRLTLGLHGTTPLRYHAFSHVVYGLMARLLRVPVAWSYGLATSLVFVPLLFAALLTFAGERQSLATRRAFAGAVVLLLSFVIGFAGRPLLEACTLWHSYFLSESYLLGLVVFTAFLSFLFGARPSGFVATGFLVVLTMTKASVGAIAGGLLAVMQWRAVRRGDETPARAGATLAVAGAATLAALLAFSPQGNTGKIEFLTFVDSYLTSSCPVAGAGFPSRVAAFIGVHYLFLWAAAAAWWLTRAPGLTGPLVLAATAAALGFVPLSMQIPAGGAFYFSNVATFAALPIVLACAGGLDAGSSRRRRVVAGVLLLTGVAGVLLSGVRFVARRVVSVRTAAAAPVTASAVTPYVHRLLAIGARPREARLLVYIPKSETDYWGAPVSDCTRMGALIPALSARPALFGLPEAACREKIGRDYSGYEPQFAAAARAAIPADELCAETRRLGYDGYIEVRRADARTYGCASPGH